MAESDFIDTFRRIMTRPERYESGRVRVPLILGVLILAMLPLVAPLATKTLYQAPQDLAEKLPDNPITEAARKALDNFDEGFRNSPPEERETWRFPAAQRARDALVNLSGDPAASNKKKQVTAQKKFRARALLICTGSDVI